MKRRMSDWTIRWDRDLESTVLGGRKSSGKLPSLASRGGNGVNRGGPTCGIAQPLACDGERQVPQQLLGEPELKTRANQVLDCLWHLHHPKSPQIPPNHPREGRRAMCLVGGVQHERAPENGMRT